jgi:hypothetical protein
MGNFDCRRRGVSIVAHQMSQVTPKRYRVMLVTGHSSKCSYRKSWLQGGECLRAGFSSKPDPGQRIQSPISDLDAISGSHGDLLSSTHGGSAGSTAVATEGKTRVKPCLSSNHFNHFEWRCGYPIRVKVQSASSNRVLVGRTGRQPSWEGDGWRDYAGTLIAIFGPACEGSVATNGNFQLRLTGTVAMNTENESWKVEGQ